MGRVCYNLFCTAICTLVFAVAASPQTQKADGDRPAEKLYLQLGSVGLDGARVYHIRDASLDRAAVHITLNDGTIAFTQDVAGRVTGAFFEGDGEVLISPPNRVERASMALFTGSAILEESFSTAYFRFNDQSIPQWKTKVSPTDNGPEFINQWNETATVLAQMDALRLFLTFAKDLSPSGTPKTQISSSSDSFLHARIQGRKLGKFDIYYDTQSPEQVRVSQSHTVNEQAYYDTWTSFALDQPRKSFDDLTSDTGDGANADAIHIQQYKIRAEVTPPTELKATAELQIDVHEGGQSAILFELSRFLKLDEVTADGVPIEFIHNPSLEGSHLAIRGDDLLAVVFPKPLTTGQHLVLQFSYSGAVVADAGGGLLYVGARGTWYPNRGLVMANYDLQFRYPAAWELVATGKPAEIDASEQAPAGGQIGRWISERPIPVAGFNLGKYSHAQAHAGTVPVDVYAARGVEKTFSLGATGSNPSDRPDLSMAIAPSPAKNAQPVADFAASVLDFFSHKYGRYNFGGLAITQMPGSTSQGWPGLIFLSSLSFLTDSERAQLHMSDVEKTLGKYILAHETAHQWWGDTVSWAGYRDQWLVEALSNYCALMMLESRDPEQFHAAMEQYRQDLLVTNDKGTPISEDGPVTLGGRLSNSQFPNGYEAISYERGTWLLHMLRNMLKNANHDRDIKPGELEPFDRALLKIRNQYEGKPITTAELIHGFESELPPSLYYDGRKSLDWFYQGWVTGTSIPRLGLQNVKFTDHATETLVNGTITQSEAPDDLVTPVPVYAVGGKKTVLIGQVLADGPETPFHLKSPAGTRKILLDPERTLLTQEK